MPKENLIEILKTKGFSDKVVNAFSKVRREDFIPERYVGYVYDDIALPTADGSSVSQPSTIALMLDLLELKQGQKIMEIGSGSGYVLALMSEIIKDGKIFGIERLKEVAIRASEILAKDSNIKILIINGFNGIPEQAPFDRILVSASANELPRHLLKQLKPDGIMVCPVGTSIFQLKKADNRVEQKEFPGFVFVPFVKED